MQADLLESPTKQRIDKYINNIIKTHKQHQNNLNNKTITSICHEDCKSIHLALHSLEKRTNKHTETYELATTISNSVKTNPTQSRIRLNPYATLTLSQTSSTKSKNITY